MAVMTSQKTSDPTEQDLTNKRVKCYYKTRPITATLEHPLILDVKLLKKLDMTTFTKKSLIALSKFCGISLITKTDTKRKFNKCLKSSSSKKPTTDNINVGMFKSQFKEPNKKDLKAKRKHRKQIPKPGSRSRFKTAEENVSVDEDSADVICKLSNKTLTTSDRLTKSPGNVKLTDRRLIINDIINATTENVIPEPCKTCCRSEYPERFHSHPKTSMKLNLGQKIKEKNLEEATNSTLGTDDSEKVKKKMMQKSSSANHKASSQESLSLNEECLQSPDNDISTRSSPKLPVKSINPTQNPLPELENKQKPKTEKRNVKKGGSEVKANSEMKSGKIRNEKVEDARKEENQPDEDALKYITGCYLCGKQVSPKMRMKHEESCIVEWRTRNSLLSPDKRKPEPRRPDFRFTVTGELDCEGTFESIWANHKESLVPCKKCGRTFFPDRIKKHENCCTNAPFVNKYKR